MKLHRGMEGLEQGEAPHVTDEYDPGRRDGAHSPLEHRSQVLDARKVLHDRVQDDGVEAMRLDVGEITRLAPPERYMRQAADELWPQHGDGALRKVRSQVGGASGCHRQEQETRAAADLPDSARSEGQEPLDRVISPGAHRAWVDWLSGIAAVPASRVETRIDARLGLPVGTVVQRAPLRNNLGLQGRLVLSGLARSAARDHVGGQSLLARGVLARQHHGVPNRRVLPQHGLDLAELDAVAADLHLVVHPAQELDVSIREPAREIACAIHARTTLIRESIGEEPRFGQLATVQVAAGDADPGHVELTRNTGRNGLTMWIENVNTHIVDGSTNAGIGRRGLALRLQRWDRARRRDDRPLGWTIVVHDLER